MNTQLNDPEIVRGTLLAAIIGDALGTPFEGLGKAHLHAVFRDLDGYTDPEPALKGHLDRWRKPGLYSSISQLMLLYAGALTARRRDPVSAFSGLVRAAPAVEGGMFGPFRHAGAAERGMLERLMSADTGHRMLDSLPCARPVAGIVPLGLFAGEDEPVPTLARAAALWSRERFTASGAIIGASILRRAVRDRGEAGGGLLKAAVLETGMVIADLDENSPGLFSLGFNPDSLLDAARLFEAALRAASAARDIAAAETAIIRIVNTILKTPVTRATVNHPLCVLPFALAYARFFSDAPVTGLLHAVMEGGSCASLAALAAAYLAAAHGTGWIPEGIFEGIINKSRITALCESLARGRVGETELSEFIAAEAGLTRKELQELGGRTRHFSPKTKKQLTRTQAEERIARITVESWTKADRAKWKKDKKNYDKHQE
ncbi:MAG: ADP-ribosylglycohydrolase family protein [Spirochaetes bacterium]|nr:MAG: ADP-ribosylglycohydrolase family protein [Spirochaetota bacterium]